MFNIIKNNDPVIEICDESDRILATEESGLNYDYEIDMEERYFDKLSI